MAKNSINDLDEFNDFDELNYNAQELEDLENDFELTEQEIEWLDEEYADEIENYFEDIDINMYVTF